MAQSEQGDLIPRLIRAAVSARIQQSTNRQR